MNRLTTYEPPLLPATIEDLSRFVLVGREKLTAVRAAIRAIDRVQLAQEVRDQKMEEARMLSEALLDAEVRLGEMTKTIPKALGGRPLKTTDSAVVSFGKSKSETVHELGFTPKQVERFETLAANKDLVEQVKREARENDDIPTRTQVLSLAAHRKKQQEQEAQQIDDDARKHKRFIEMVHVVLAFADDNQELEALADSIARSCGGALLANDIDDLSGAIEILTVIRNKLLKKGAAYGKK